jgi:hypothetical protein
MLVVQMNIVHPERLIIVGVGLMLFGCIAPFMMVIHVWESTFFLNFLAYTTSVLGMVLGFIGVATLRARQKSSEDEDENKYR